MVFIALVFHKTVYDTTINELFTTLDRIDQHLKDNDYRAYKLLDGAT